MNGSLESWLRVLEREHATVGSRDFDAIRALADELSVVRTAESQVIIGGTNGKGSVLFALERMLISLGYSVGVTCSPHLIRYNERFRINGAEADDSSIVRAIEHVYRKKGSIELTYFDITTLAALVLFERAGIEFALVEVGLGGALDCANVIEPDAACITNVSMDHMDRLGNTRNEIASEKAGILRENLPFIYGETDVPSTLSARAKDLNCRSYWFGSQFGILKETGIYATKATEKFTFEVSGGDVNLSTAVQIAMSLNIMLNSETVSEAAQCSLPARLEEITVGDRTWILDIAHNPGAMQFVLREIQKRTSLSNVVCVFACLADKQVDKLLAQLIPIVKYVVVTDSLGARGLSASQAMRTTGDHGNVTRKADLCDALQAAKEIADIEDLLLVCGSVDVVTRAKQQLQSS